MTLPNPCVRMRPLCAVAPSRRSLFKLRSMVRDALAKFDRIYDLQAGGRVFETPEQLWSESCGLYQTLF